MSSTGPCTALLALGLTLTPNNIYKLWGAGSLAPLSGTGMPSTIFQPKLVVLDGLPLSTT